MVFNNILLWFEIISYLFTGFVCQTDCGVHGFLNIKKKFLSKCTKKEFLMYILKCKYRSWCICSPYYIKVASVTNEILFNFKSFVFCLACFPVDYPNKTFDNDPFWFCVVLNVPRHSHPSLPCEAVSRGLISSWGPFAGPSGDMTVSSDMRQSSFCGHSRRRSSLPSSAFSAVETSVSSWAETRHNNTPFSSTWEVYPLIITRRESDVVSL